MKKLKFIKPLYANEAVVIDEIMKLNLSLFKTPTTCNYPIKQLHVIDENYFVIRLDECQTLTIRDFDSTNPKYQRIVPAFNNIERGLFHRFRDDKEIPASESDTFIANQYIAREIQRIKDCIIKVCSLDASMRSLIVDYCMYDAAISKMEIVTSIAQLNNVKQFRRDDLVDIAKYLPEPTFALSLLNNKDLCDNTFKNDIMGIISLTSIAKTHIKAAEFILKNREIL